MRAGFGSNSCWPYKKATWRIHRGGDDTWWRGARGCSWEPGSRDAATWEAGGVKSPLRETLGSVVLWTPCSQTSSPWENHRESIHLLIEATLSMVLSYSSPTKVIREFRVEFGSTLILPFWETLGLRTRCGWSMHVTQRPEKETQTQLDSSWKSGMELATSMKAFLLLSDYHVNW